MARETPEGTGAWNFRDIPRELMRKVKMAAAHEGKTVKEFLIELAEARIQELRAEGNSAEREIAVGMLTGFF